MAYKIGLGCVRCGLCDENCPASCIILADEQFVIDGELCLECGACDEVCLPGAVYKDA